MDGTGHGHVTPRADGGMARCGGPALCPECARERAETGQPALTGLRANRNCEDWPVRPDRCLSGDEESPDVKVFATFRTDPHTGQQLPMATLRRIGWLDQKGRVWLKVPPSSEFDGGSLAPLLIDPGERDGT
jgi:hypothetical protein